MKKSDKGQNAGSPVQVTAEEALQRMKRFAERKEKFVAAIKKSQDRNISA